MCEEEQDRVLVYIGAMLGMKAHGFSQSAGGQTISGEDLMTLWRLK